jgi:tRNA G37 N-methylase Trm5
MNLTSQAHSLLSGFLEKISSPTAVDASCGNGHDTLALAKLGCSVFAFDIQDAAIEATRARLKENSLDEKVSIFKHSHSDMLSVIPKNYHGTINAAVFNLGWLPKSDKTVVTLPETTIIALESLKYLLDPRHNLVSILAYRGHKGGCEEFNAVRKFAESYSPLVFGDESNANSPVLFIFSV